MTEFFNSLLLISAYLIGSFSTAVWLGSWFYGVDVREYGSGNAGATNAFRVLGARIGIPVLLIDVLKGWLGVHMAYLPELFYTPNFQPGSEQFINFQLALGISVLVGHVFPVFSGFRGGKGIATLLGIIVAINALASLYVMLVFLSVLLLSRYVSVSSMISALAFPVVIMGVFENTIPSLNLFATFVPILVIITHQKNIERLLRREESKVKMFKKKRKKNRTLSVY